MGATEIVAIVGAISTPVVAIAGYVFNERRSRDDRAATRKLTEDSHAHERQLAEGQREHEERLRRNERLYNARREAYLDVLRQTLVEVQIVERTENPISLREPPEMPRENEWRDLRARVGAFGSREVGDAVKTFDSKVREFHNAVNAYRGMSERPAPDAAVEEFGEITKARGEATAAYEAVRTLVRDELANL
jgi:hypothetical protein